MTVSHAIYYNTLIVHGIISMKLRIFEQALKRNEIPNSWLGLTPFHRYRGFSSWFEVESRNIVVRLTVDEMLAAGHSFQFHLIALFPNA